MGNVDNPHVLWMVRASRDREAASKKQGDILIKYLIIASLKEMITEKKPKFDGFGIRHRHAQMPLSSCFISLKIWAFLQMVHKNPKPPVPFDEKNWLK